MEYEYFIQSIPVKHQREGYTLEDYVPYIHQYAGQGWRFIELVSLVDFAPKHRRIDLIFERKIEKEEEK